jgi:hypothetical protein
VRALVEAIAIDIQPICQMRVLKYIGKDKEADWITHFFKEGFAGTNVQKKRALKTRKKIYMNTLPVLASF